MTRLVRDIEAPLRSEIGRLRDALIQIRAVCEDNQSSTCDHEKALLFVRQVVARVLKD